MSSLEKSGLKRVKLLENSCMEKISPKISHIAWIYQHETLKQAINYLK